MAEVPKDPKIYHIVHVDKLRSIIQDGFVFFDDIMRYKAPNGTAIGMNTIKDRRLTELRLQSHQNLFVGQCVPFYFCPRSVMLYMLHRGNHTDITYHGGQQSIVHLEADLKSVVNWADAEGLRWAFTKSNAGAYYFEDLCDLERLRELDWSAIETHNWASRKDGKQAECLIEKRFPWQLVSRIGVHSQPTYTQVSVALKNAEYKPHAEILRNWYY